uniref:Family with sequence similarity 169 member Aa n=1 Tax=Hucho hucho TaxID=62062 RepID=A0A4W5LP90_9TELE
MEFPVDSLVSVSQEILERSAQDYMNSLLHIPPDSPQHLTLANNTQVPIGLSNVGFVPLYGANMRQKVLALFSQQDQFTAVGLFLLDRWWSLENILKTADSAKDGAVEVETIGERIVLYVLNRVVYRAKEISSGELPFLCHGENDYAKILWKDGQAVGFYSVKPSGSLCSSFLTQCYHIPVMDSIFVRKCHRGNGLGLQMLENFVDSFKEECLGLKYPLSKAMYKVCGKYLSLYPAHRDLLWEVESVGGPSQRTNIANKIQAMAMSSMFITDLKWKMCTSRPLTCVISVFIVYSICYLSRLSLLFSCLRATSHTKPCPLSCTLSLKERTVARPWSHKHLLAVQSAVQSVCMVR